MTSLPIQLYQAQHVRECDRRVAIALNLSGLQLMQRAADAVWTEITQRWSQVQRIAVFCGTGNNGGDGYLLATLALAAHRNVTVYSVGALDNLTGDALLAYQTYVQAGGQVRLFSETVNLKAELLVDALFGTGLNRPLTGIYTQAIESINHFAGAILSVDMPSGLNADTGNSVGGAVQADVTVTFIALKQGMLTGDGVECCGEIVYADLGTPAQAWVAVPHSAERLTESPLARRQRNAHKGHYGHVLVIGGEQGFAGAARLAGEAALRTGAGLVSVATRAVHAPFIGQGRPELMCHAVEYLIDFIPLLSKATVLVLGTGLGQHSWGQALFAAAMAQAHPLVVDADGLNLLAQQPDYRANWILTPHPKEAARLLGCSTAEVNADRFAAVTKIQAKFGGVCVLKGAGSLICDGKNMFVCTAGNPGMASGGMGDVLAGVIGGLLAQGFDLINAAKTGTYLHSHAADLAAADFGERGLLASDLMPYLRRLVN